MLSCLRLARIIGLMALFATAGLAADLVRIDDLTVLDPVTGQTFATAPPQPDASWPPPAAAASRDIGDGYAGCSTSDSCAPFKLVEYTPGTAIDLLPEGNYPYDATLNQDATELWIPGASGDGVIVIDRATNVIMHRIPVAEYPISVAFSGDGALALVTSRDTEEVTLVDTASYTVTGHLPVPTTYLGAGNIALDPLSGNFYLVDWYGDELFEVAPDGSAILRQATIGDSLWQLVVAPDGQAIYVTDRATDVVKVIDPATLTELRSVSVGDDPWGIDVTADGGKLVVSCEDSHDVHIIDTSSWEVTAIALAATADPRDVDILDGANLAYVAGGAVTGGSNPVYVIDLVDDTLRDTFEAVGSNVNVIAVQAQMGQDITAVADQLPRARSALTASPNPFNPRTRITYTLSEAASVDLAVFDLQGRRLRTLAAGRRAVGQYEASWDGRDRHGHQAGSGIYFLRLDAGRQSRSLKLVMMK